MKIHYELYIEEYELEVKLECDCTVENSGIGSYEYWGSKEHDAGENYLSCERITWNEEGYSDEVNKLIDQYIKENYSEIADEAIEKFDPSDYI